MVKKRVKEKYQIEIFLKNEIEKESQVDSISFVCRRTVDGNAHVTEPRIIPKHEYR